MKKAMIFIASFAIMMLSLSALSPQKSEARLSQEAPAVVVRSAFASSDSLEAPLSELRGQWVVLSFWTSTDARSRALQHGLTALQKAAAGNPLASQMATVSVNLDSSTQLMREIVRRDGLDEASQFHVGSPDAARSLRRAYQMEGACRTFLLDPQGRVVKADPALDELSELINA